MGRVKFWILLIILAINYGCKPDTKQFLQGSWINEGSKGESVNDFWYIEFKGDSVKLCDYDLVSYHTVYKIEDDSIFIGDIKSAFAIVDDTTIELLNHYFVKKEHARELDAYQDIDRYKGVEINLPEYMVYQDTFKSLNPKNLYTENISIDVINGRNTLFLYGYKAFINDLEGMGSSHQRVEAITLFIDKAASMDFVDSVFRELDSMQIYKVSFVLGNKINETLKPKTEMKMARTSGWVDTRISPLMITPDPKYIKTKDVIDICNNHLLFNGNESDSLSVLDSLRNLILAKPERCVFIVYNNSTTYNFFIRYLAAVRNLYSELRNHESFIRYQKSYNSLGEVFKTEIVRTLPQRIIFLDSLTYQRYWNVPYEGY